jgi:hypothetical protein
LPGSGAALTAAMPSTATTMIRCMSSHLRS